MATKKTTTKPDPRKKYIRYTIIAEYDALDPEHATDLNTALENLRCSGSAEIEDVDIVYKAS